MPSPLPAPAPQLAPQRSAQVFSASTSRPGELPPSACRQTSMPGFSGLLQVLRRSPRLAAITAAAGLVAIFAPFLSWDHPGETVARNWRHHQQATDQCAQSGNRPSTLLPAIKWITPTGAARFQSTVPLTAADFDQATSRQVLEAIQQHNHSVVDAVVKNAQVGLPSGPVANVDTPATPELSPGMREEIRRGDARFHHLFLFDSCDEDGDVVDIVIDGHRFATVPITKQGTTLSIPLGLGRPTSIVIRGVYDGGGGITVACQTSRGEGFLRVLLPGEEQPLALVVE